MTSPTPPEQGAFYRGEGRTDFCVWSPFTHQIHLHLIAPTDQLIPMQKCADGYHRVTVEGGLAAPGARYLYRLDDRAERPDPASRSQPDGVHSASEVVSLPPLPDDGWQGIGMSDLILYEMHVGTFTAEGTFEAVIPYIDLLKEIGITAIELMPVTQCPGARNWGYDGVYLYAAQSSCGGAPGLRRLVDACHARGMAVILDVVYNHLGPEGNYLRDFAPYFTDHYRVPWGAAVNLDGRFSDDVRAFFVNNLRWWVDSFGIDGFRLDAVQELYDMTAYHFLRELADAAHAADAERSAALKRRILVIAESNLNDPRLTDSPERNGFGLDGEWADDFHHAVHSLVTGETMSYYADFGDLAPLVKVLKHGYARTGEYSVVRGRRHGAMPPPHMTADRFVVFTQNHDQVGNRLVGDRLSATLDFDSLKLLAGILCLSPFVPLLFMGEEYGETAPFPFFVDHGDPGVIEGTRRGRKEWFRHFTWTGEMPDPAAETTFASAKLNHALRTEGHHRLLQDLYRELLRLRREHPALRHLSRDDLEAIGYEPEKVLYLRRWHGDEKTARASLRCSTSGEPRLPYIRRFRRGSGSPCLSPGTLIGAVSTQMVPSGVKLPSRRIWQGAHPSPCRRALSRSSRAGISEPVVRQALEK